MTKCCLLPQRDPRSGQGYNCTKTTVDIIKAWKYNKINIQEQQYTNTGTLYKQVSFWKIRLQLLIIYVNLNTELLLFQFVWNYHENIPLICPTWEVTTKHLANYCWRYTCEHLPVDFTVLEIDFLINCCPQSLFEPREQLPGRGI